MIWKRTLVVLLGLALLAVAGLRYWPLTGVPIPSLGEFKIQFLDSDLTILDRNGQVFGHTRIDKSVRRLSWIPLAEISQATKVAVVVAEDQRFYRHAGVDFWGVLGAIKDFVIHRKIRGASTISMQVANYHLVNMDGKPAQRWQLKILQMRAAWLLERRWSKNEILEAYLNLIPFKGELVGVAAASHGLFQKFPIGLDKNESIILAAMIRSPNANRVDLVRRAENLNKILVEPNPQDAIHFQRMVDRIYRSPYQVKRSSQVGYHVSAAIRKQVKNLPLQKNRRIQSTIDLEIQSFANEVLSTQLKILRGQNVRDGAVLVLDNKSGDVLAYVGNANQGLSKSWLVDGVRARRQAGSTLKSLLYAKAIDQKYLTAASILKDEPFEINMRVGNYQPDNYDHQFHGNVSVRTALASSLNIPAVRTLDLLGVDEFVDTLNDLHFENLRSSEFYGPSLALGSADVSLWSLTNAYRTLANGGLWQPIQYLKGQESSDEPRRVFSEASAFITGDILASRSSRALGFGLENVLSTPFWAAAKTGTSKDMRDNWCIGYTPRFTVGVWVGNFEGEPMWQVSGISGAAPAWSTIMKYLNDRYPSGSPQPPSTVVQKSIVVENSDATPDKLQREWFITGTQTSAIALNHSIVKAEISYPKDGTIVGYDPDIPPERQVMFVDLSAGHHQVTVKVDGREYKRDQGIRILDLSPGRHLIELFDKQDNRIQEATFIVRGKLDQARL